MTDVLIIGWGKGGKTLAGTLARAGRSVTLVEQSSAMYGGACINVACIPTKILVHDSQVPHGTDYDATVFAAAVDRRDTLTAAMRAKNYDMLDTVDGVTLIDGTARFVDASTVEVATADGATRISAETIIINTGATPTPLDLPGADGPRVHDSESIQHVDPLPKRLLVVGDGPIGLEFASMFAGFGSSVRVLSRHDRLLARDDEDVAQVLTDVLTDAGVEIVTGAAARAFTDTGTEVTVTAEIGGETREFAADAVLLATGRSPNTADLDLAAAGVDVDDRGAVVVDDRLRTSAPGVYAIGDVHGGPQFTYLSLDDNRILEDLLLGAGDRRVSDRVAVPTTTFVTPPLARVGLSETQARERGLDVIVASTMVRDIPTLPRPKIVNNPAGIIKVVVDASSKQILGATLFCVDSQEVVNLVALAMRHGITAPELASSIFTHPSTSEMFNGVLAGI
ncbi:dihydrolipoyl dehydrogenase family protein [Gordonia hydrophobica]|uniref:FAD-dependent oxidoreductase n=1 Tax=Gordonia hydrophobica TaxID=40516 RepID=A0ABZ2U5K8_9ACTN|nr:FAD-dependent oxidoreductase [Gordonia hydrophobica]MBM7368711.1 pyruvate/2-oxoglutarate dehydrogenase complex dihydrolipoamide dehydrogenase (E3) component [Gordonia hydrophobica]